MAPPTNDTGFCASSGKSSFSLSILYLKSLSLIIVKMLNFKYTGTLRKYADEEALFVSMRAQKDGSHRASNNAIERLIRELGQSCGVKAHPHKFRRTFATNLLNKDVPIEQIKELLGHANLDTTMIYAITDQDQIRYNHKKFAG